MSLTAEKALPYPDVIPYDKQSIPIPGTKRPGQTGKLKHVELSAQLNTFCIAHYQNGMIRCARFQHILTLR